MRLSPHFFCKLNPFAKPDGGTVYFDHLKIFAKGGRGGNGFSWLGGVGGAGGDIYLISKWERKHTLGGLANQKPNLKFVANDGRRSTRHRILGDKGGDLFIPVPLGVSVSEISGDSLIFMGDLVQHKQRLLIAKGGIGGGAENSFVGQEGESKEILIDLKILADVGFVGFPNAGKSTLLKAISNAEPAVSFWPFTTMRPQISRLKSPLPLARKSHKIFIADLPGIIEGAHKNEGLGYAFLKHVERTHLMLFIVDIHGFQLTPQHPFRNAVETVLLLNKELEFYNPELLNKPCILCLNKIDTDPTGAKTKGIISELEKLPGNLHLYDSELLPNKLLKYDEIIPISAKNPESTQPLCDRLRTFVHYFRNVRKQLLSIDYQPSTANDFVSEEATKIESFNQNKDQGGR